MVDVSPKPFYRLIADSTGLLQHITKKCLCLSKSYGIAFKFSVALGPVVQSKPD